MTRMRIREVFNLLSNVALPAHSSSSLKHFSLALFLMGNHVSVPDAHVPEFRLALHNCISANLDIAYQIKFAALILITKNPWSKQSSELLDLYAEILVSDLGLMNEFDEKWSSLVVAAAAYEHLEILRILKRYNAPMQAVIPANSIDRMESNPLSKATEGETAAHTYIRGFVPRRSPAAPTVFTLERTVPIMNILLTGAYTPERVQKIINFALDIMNRDQARFRHAFDFFFAEEGILSFIAPQVIRRRINTATLTPQPLMDFLDGSGDAGVLRNIYSFLAPKM